MTVTSELPTFVKWFSSCLKERLHMEEETVRDAFPTGQLNSNLNWSWKKPKKSWWKRSPPWLTEEGVSVTGTKRWERVIPPTAAGCTLISVGGSPLQFLVPKASRPREPLPPWLYSMPCQDSDNLTFPGERECHTSWDRFVYRSSVCVLKRVCFAFWEKSTEVF